MKKRTKAEKAQEKKKRCLEERLADSKKQTEEMWLKIKKAPRQSIEVATLEIVNGKHIEEKQKIVVVAVDQQLSREYDDAMRAQGRIEYEIGEIESLLFPRKGAPPKYNPALIAAARERLNPMGRLLSYPQLAIKHFRPKDSREITRLADLIKKKVRNLRKSVPLKSSDGPSAGK